MTNLSVSALEINKKWSSIMHVIAAAVKGTSHDHIYRESWVQNLLLDEDGAV